MKTLIGSAKGSCIGVRRFGNGVKYLRILGPLAKGVGGSFRADGARADRRVGYEWVLLS